MLDTDSTPPVRVLVVDDDPNHLRLLAAGLRVEGFIVEAAPNATAAMAALVRATVDVAVVDVMMPGTNGLDLARQISRDFPAIRVILMSAYHLSERQLRRTDCGAVGFIPKPYRLEELAAYLRVKARASVPPPAAVAS